MPTMIRTTKDYRKIAEKILNTESRLNLKVNKRKDIKVKVKVDKSGE